MSVETLIPDYTPDSRFKTRRSLRREALPFSAELSRDQLVECVSEILSGTMNALGQIRTASSNPGPSSIFHAKKVPSISLLSYIQRFAKFSRCSDSCFVMLLIFIDRISESNPNFELDALNVHRITLLSLVSAAKFQDDAYLKNKSYAEIGGVKTDDLNKLEAEFLSNGINFKLYVEEYTFKKYQKYCQDYFHKKMNQQEN